MRRGETDPSLPTGPKILSESEIQERLYGPYRIRQRNSGTVTTHSASPEWTGAEILAGELNRLRSELISLRQEKERLVSQLQQLSHREPDVPVPSTRPEAFQGFERWTVIILLLGMVGYFGVKRLQASPVPSGEPTPYTVQVAVYDVRPMAEEAMSFLQRLQYDAFLIAMPRQDGRIRYRIYVGSFVTKEEADLERMRLSGDPRFRDFKDAFVRVR